MLASDPVTDMAVHAKLMEQASGPGTPDDHWVQFSRGLYEYRAGGFHEAIEWLEKGRARHDGSALLSVELLLAMARHRLRQGEPERRALGEALERVDRQEGRDAGDPRADVPHGWLM